MIDSFLEKHLLEALNYNTNFSYLKKFVISTSFRNLKNKEEYYDRAFQVYFKAYTSDLYNIEVGKIIFLQIVLNLDKVHGSNKYYSLAVNEFLKLENIELSFELLIHFLLDKSTNAQELFPLEYKFYHNLQKNNKINLNHFTPFFSCPNNKLNIIAQHLEIAAYNKLDFDTIMYFRKNPLNNISLFSNEKVLPHFYKLLDSLFRLNSSNKNQVPYEKAIKFFMNEYDIDINYNDNMIIKACCHHGSSKFVKYLLTSKELKQHANIYADNCSAFKKAYNNGKMDVIKYLIFDYKIEKTQAINFFLERKFVDTSDLRAMFLTRSLNESLQENKPTTKRFKL